MAPRVLVVVLVLLAACSDPAEGAGDSTTTTTTCAPRAAQLDVPYVEDGDPAQRLDLYLPPGAGCAPVPVVVWVHGGGWQIGDKANGMDAKVRQWTGAGWAVASVNYRLTDVEDPAAARVVAPSHNEDVAAALGWLAAEGATVGVDPHRIALVGHSAGAAIVAAVGVDPTYLGAHGLDPASIACVAPLDTEGFDVTSVIDGGGAIARLYRSVFGEDRAEWEELSPLHHVGDAPVPDLFLVRRGSARRQAQVDAFEAAAVEAGSEVTVVDLPDFSHEDVNRRIGDPSDDELTPALQAFLEQCLTT